MSTVLFNCDIELDGKDFALSDSILRISTKRVNEIDAIVEKASAHVGAAPTKKHTLLAPAEVYIAAHPDEKVSIALLARQCHLSESFFRKKFGEAYGVSPKEYCLQMRLDRAKTLLELGELNVSQVSNLLGFSSPSYFSRIFRKKFGVSPVACLQK